jgi:hypothetical protein
LVDVRSLRPHGQWNGSNGVLRIFGSTGLVLDREIDVSVTKEEWMGASQRDILNAEGLAVAVGTIIADRPRTEPYVRFYAYGSRLG